MKLRWAVVVSFAINILVVASFVLADIRPTTLRCEYLENPMGIDATIPRLRWVVESSERGQRQTAYHVLVASDRDMLDGNNGDLWDSGQVESDQSIHVDYGGKPLTSAMRCWWKVRIRDVHGKPSSWSEPARWSMGLLSASDWKGKWIGQDDPPAMVKKESILQSAKWVWFPEGEPAKAAPPEKRFFRRVIVLPTDRQIAGATGHFTADNQFVLYVNGQRVGAGSHFKSAPEIDLTEHLRGGTNVLAIMASNASDTPNPAGMLGVVRIDFLNGPPLAFSTDSQWKASKKEPAEWKTIEFDDSSWSAAMELGLHGMAPWCEVVTSTNGRVLPARMLRRVFRLDQPIKEATLFVSGLGYCELYLNGRKVGTDVLNPAVSEYNKRVFYQTYDVAEQLQEGKNAVGAWLGNGRYYAPRTKIPIETRSYGFPKLLLQLQVVYEDGSQQQMVSDERWKLTTGGPIRANNDYDGEEYDARMELPGWDTIDYDDATWQTAQVVSPPGGKLESQMIEPMRVTQTLRPVAVTNPQAGVSIFDMGQNMVGRCRLTVSGPRGTRVLMKHAEVLGDNGMLYMANIRGAKATDTYTLKGDGTETYEPRFTYHGFRYVAVRGFPGTPDLSAIEGRVIHNDLRRMGDFTCSNELLNQIYRNVLWGVRGNALGVPTDCPQRDERQGWLGDPAARSKGDSFYFGVARFYGKWLRDIQDAQNEAGCIPDVAPSFWPLYTANVTWPSAYVIIPNWFHDQYADIRVLATHYDSIKVWIDFMAQYLDADGLMPPTTDRYGDWCVPPESPELIHSKDPARQTAGDFLASAYYYRDLCLLERYATLLKKLDDAQQLHDRAEKFRTAFNKKYYDSTSGVYANGSQTSSILPLYFGIVPENDRRRVAKGLAENILEKSRGHIGTGLIGGQWLMRTLTDAGYADIAYRLATNDDYPSWGYMIENDATTVWELWNGNTANPAMNSHNHLMLVGDLVVWFYESLAGIKSDPAQPGFKHILMHPRPVGDLRFVKAHHMSPYGKISSHWRIEDQTFHWTIVIPANTTATVRVPTSNRSAVQEGDRPASESTGVEVLRLEEEGAVYRVAPGTYRFTAPHR